MTILKNRKKDVHVDIGMKEVPPNRERKNGKEEEKVENSMDGSVTAVEEQAAGTGAYHSKNLNGKLIKCKEQKQVRLVYVLSIDLNSSQAIRTRQTLVARQRKGIFRNAKVFS